MCVCVWGGGGVWCECEGVCMYACVSVGVGGCGWVYACMRVLCCTM